jgi:hypothetical protein
MKNQNNSHKAFSSAKDTSYAASQVLFSAMFLIHAISILIILGALHD